MDGPVRVRLVITSAADQLASNGLRRFAGLEDPTKPLFLARPDFIGAFTKGLVSSNTKTQTKI